MDDWPATPEELVRLQEDLGQEEPAAWTATSSTLSAGCFICFGRSSAIKDRGWAASALVRRRRLLAVEVVEGEAQSAYEPGLLALREGPLLEAAVRALPERPEVLFVNATGRDHPRRAGLAVHLGAVLDLPTIGVTERTLVASGDLPATERGSASPLSINDQVIGYWLRTRTAVRPVAVHAGWRTDPETAVEVTMESIRRTRTPEPIRRARHAARTARSVDEGRAPPGL